ncbi:MAG: hypothetical protein QOE04_4399 [Mycobacterium sp.]|jgi:hypothetical protein|nr:hypothetical protein [Mycobacterium sp.]
MTNDDHKSGDDSASTRHQRLREALRCAASGLKAHGPEFALGGSYALWVHGGPEPVHDVDLVVAEVDAAAAATSLGKAGFDITRPPEDWLFKAALDGAVVDVLHRLNGVPVNTATLAGAEVHQVLAIDMPVLSPTSVVTVKLRSLNEHYCDFATLLPAVRAVRERVDWSQVRDETDDNPFAAAFLVLLGSLRII